MLQYFAGIGTLPDYPARFRVDHLPGTEKDGRLIGTLVVQLAAERRCGERWPGRGHDDGIGAGQGTNMVALYPGGPRSSGPKGAEDSDVRADTADVGVKV